MPKKASNPDEKKGRQLGVTLTPGGRFMLDQLVAQQLIGEGYSEVLRNVVLVGLEALKAKYNLKYLHEEGVQQSRSDPSNPATPVVS